MKIARKAKKWSYASRFKKKKMEIRYKELLYVSLATTTRKYVFTKTKECLAQMEREKYERILSHRKPFFFFLLVLYVCVHLLITKRASIHL